MCFICFCCPLVLQAQQESFKQEDQEHRASYLEVQSLRSKLDVAQGRIHSQELEVERLRALESQLEQNRSDQQVSCKKYGRMSTCVKVIYSLLTIAHS